MNKEDLGWPAYIIVGLVEIVTGCLVILAVGIPITLFALLLQWVFRG